MQGNPETLVLSILLEKRCMQDAIAAGLRPTHFATADHKAAFEYLVAELKNPKKMALPTVGKFIQKNPWFQPMPIPAGMTIQAAVAELVEASLQREVASALFDLSTRKNSSVDDVKSIIGKLRDVVHKHNVLDFVHSGAAASVAMVRKWYEDGVNKDTSITGIPYPWAPLNAETRGIHQHDFILLYGRPKNGKTWQLMTMVTHLHSVLNGPVLFVSYEMDLQRLLNRLSCLVAKISYDKFNKGLLCADEHQKLENALASLEDAKASGRGIYFAGPGVCSTGRKGFSLLDVEGAVDEIKPRAVFIDGILHATDARTGKKSRDWNVISNISSDAKQLSLAYNIPLICTHQANREGEKSPSVDTQTDIAYADALAQDCDLTIRVTLIRTSDGARRVLMIPEGMREFDVAGFTTGGEFCEDMEYKSMVARSDLKKLLARSEDHMKDTPKAAPKPGLQSVMGKLK